MSSYGNPSYNLRPQAVSTEKSIVMVSFFPPPSCEDHKGGGGVFPAPSLDKGSHKSPYAQKPKVSLTKRGRRFYHRVISGFECDSNLRFITLTSASQDGDIHRSFSAFVKRVRRAWGKFEYIAVKEQTLSGLDHLHILYKGSYLPQAWISDVWKEIHGAKIVYIAKWRGSRKKAIGYLAKYLTKATITRFWYSWGWVYRGFAGAWEDLKDILPYKKALMVWKRHLRCRNSIELVGRKVILVFGKGLVNPIYSVMIA